MYIEIYQIMIYVIVWRTKLDTSLTIMAVMRKIAY